MGNNKKYLNLEDAARLVNPNYKSSSIVAAMHRHVAEGNFKAYYPKLSIVDGQGNVLQEAGKSNEPFFLVEELLQYLKQRTENVKNGNQKPVHVVGKGIDRQFGSCKEASEELGINYFSLYHAMRNGKEIAGYKINRV